MWVCQSLSSCQRLCLYECVPCAESAHERFVLGILLIDVPKVIFKPIQGKRRRKTGRSHFRISQKLQCQNAERWAIYESLLSRLLRLFDRWTCSCNKLMPHANIEWKEKWLVHDWMKGWIIDSVSTITKKHVYSFNSEPMFLKSPGLSHILKSSQSNLRWTPPDNLQYIV